MWESNATTEFIATSTSSTSDECFPTPTSKIVITIFVTLFLIVGTFGNVVTIVVIQRTKSLQIPSNIFLLSLCCSDLISALICSPLWIYRRAWGFSEWNWPEALCIFYWVTDFTTNYATSLHIVSFAVLRFIAIKRPFQVSKISKRQVVIYVSFLWLVSTVVALPLIKLMGVENDKTGTKWPACSIRRSYAKVYNTYVSITSPVFFYLPELCVVVLSLSIAKALVKRRRWKAGLTNLNSRISHVNALDQNNHSDCQLPDVVFNTKIACNGSPHVKDRQAVPNSKSASKYHSPVEERTSANIQLTHSHALKQYHRERNTFTQLGLIVVAFMIGYIPQTVYLMWTSSVSLIERHNLPAIDYWFGVSAYLCLRLSECMNPVMYNLGSSKIRNASKKFLKETFKHS